MSLLGWNGYLEHRSPFDLQDFTANTGKGNCTIFAEMVYQRTGKYLQFLPWCVTFIFAVYEHPRRLGKPCAGVSTLRRRMVLRGKWRGIKYRAKRNDLIFCRNLPGGAIDHVGIVLWADDQHVVSIDGNTVDPTGVFEPSDGGAVAIRKRSLSDWHIAGYAKLGDYNDSL